MTCSSLNLNWMFLCTHFHQHGGDMEKAAHCMDEARSLDTADRYVNCKCAKYQLRANQVQKAEDTCGLFTRVSIRYKSSNAMPCMYIYVHFYFIMDCCKLLSNHLAYSCRWFLQSQLRCLTMDTYMYMNMCC